MKKKKVFYKKKSINILFALILAFILGFLLGVFSGDSTVSDLEIEIENLYLDMRSLNEYLTFTQHFDIDTCQSTHINSLASRIHESGIRLDQMEQEGADSSRRYDLLKQRHNVNQVIFYAELQRFQQECDFQTPVILFFFDGNNPGQARAQGNELEPLQDKLLIIPMDYGYTPSISYFYDFFEIEQLPALIINFDITLQGHSDLTRIQNALNRTQ
ncbi:MAG: hypothetical protein ACMXYF_02950 [Candidatus Woesearchaeota archaeon]